MFFKVSILNYFDLEHYIYIKMNISGNVIGRILSQPTLDHLGQCHLIAFFFWQMIPIEIYYKIHNGELLAIVKVSKTWKNYLQVCKYKILLLKDNNNF